MSTMWWLWKCDWILALLTKPHKRLLVKTHVVVDVLLGRVTLVQDVVVVAVVNDEDAAWRKQRLEIVYGQSVVSPEKDAYY